MLRLIFTVLETMLIAAERTANFCSTR
jgi:hypothetical protein